MRTCGNACIATSPPLPPRDTSSTHQTAQLPLTEHCTLQRAQGKAARWGQPELGTWGMQGWGTNSQSRIQVEHDDSKTRIPLLDEQAPHYHLFSRRVLKLNGRYMWTKEVVSNIEFICLWSRKTEGLRTTFQLKHNFQLSNTPQYFPVLEPEPRPSFEQHQTAVALH